VLKAPTILSLGLLLSGWFGASLGAQEPASEETIKFFQTNCASCHTIGGGRLTGPDLKGALERKDRDWLVHFIQGPKAVFDSGDPYALEILSAARGVPMPTIPGLGKDRASKLIDLIELESKAEKSRFAGVQLSDRPLTERDLDRGRELFMGSLRLKEGGPACISCHTVDSIGGLGGGLLGPDLSGAFARLEGRRGLGAWLAAPASQVMQPLFSEQPLDPEEILALVAYLKDNAGAPEPKQGSGSMLFVLSGIAIAALFMVAFDVLWRRRFRAVRRPLVARS